MPRNTSLALAITLLALAGCASPNAPAPAPVTPYTPSAPLPGAVKVAFTLPRDATAPGFFELPWPSELRRLANGRPDFRTYPGRDAVLFDAYVEAAESDVDGFSLSPAVYFHFTGPFTPSLPAEPRAAAAASAPVFLVDVDPASPDRGTFFPIEHRWYAESGRFVPADTLAVKPVAGVILRPATLYAAVVRRELGGPGADLGTTLDLEAVKWTSPRADAVEERARRAHEGALSYLVTLGVPRDRVAGVALFRTHTPQTATVRLVDVIEHLPKDKAARVLDAAWADDLATPLGSNAYTVVEGTYCTPNFQSDVDRAPFLAEDGGRFVLDATGAPRVIDVPERSTYHSPACGGLLRARFVLTVPRGRAMPPGGWPLLVTAHGTGGDARTFLGRDDFAGWAASQGIAVVSTDQPLHGRRGRAPRPGSREPLALSFGGIPIPLGNDARGVEAAFYNPIHPAAARDNLRQAAADLMVLARLFPATDLAPLLPPDRPAPRFDAKHVLAAGHSQGSQSVAAVGAVDPLIRGVVLSGCGGDTRLGILRRNDIPVVPAFSALLGLTPGELDPLHPLMSLVQTLADPIDPASYARYYWDPLPGHRLQNVLHYEGITDTYNPPVTAEALARALHATPLAKLLRPVDGLGAPASGFGELLRGEGARAFVQLPSTRGENGHFVLYREPGAPELMMQFLAAAVARP